MGIPWIKPFRRTVDVTGLSIACWAIFASAVIAQTNDADLTIVADQVRSQGYTCKEPQSVELLQTQSFPDQAAYLLKCEDVTYFVRLIPDQAARITVVK